MVLADDMGINVGDAGDQMTMFDEAGMPDWSNPETMGRSTGPADPPSWYRDRVNQSLEFTKRIKADQTAVMVEKGFWTISDESGNPVHIFRRADGKWDVTTETGEVISTGHRTKNVAVDKAKNMFDERKVLADFHGMSVEDFAQSGDDFDLVDGFNVLPQQTRDMRNGRATETPMHRASTGTVERVPDTGPGVKGRGDDLYEALTGKTDVEEVDEIARRTAIDSGKEVLDQIPDTETLKGASTEVQPGIWAFDDSVPAGGAETISPAAIVLWVEDVADDGSSVARVIGSVLGGPERGFNLGVLDEYTGRGLGSRLLRMTGYSADELSAVGSISEAGAATVNKAFRVSSNTKVRVFGKTADATGPVEKFTTGLRVALGKDRKIARGEVRGFGNPNIEKWTATKAWMRENGYGKLKLGDDTWLIVDEFIGGNMDDPLTRVWAPDGNKPMSSYGIDPYDAVTPNEVNEVIAYIVTHGAEMTKKELRAATKLEGVSKTQATAIRSAARQAEEAKAAIVGVRPDFDELAKTNMLTGPKSQKFLERLFSTTRGSGQTTIAALDNLLNVFQKQGIPVSNELRNALFKATDQAEVQVIFSQWLAREGGGSALLRGGGGNAGFGRMSMRTEVKEPRFPQIRLQDKPFLARRFARGMPSDPFNMVEDPSDAYRVLNEVLPNFNIKRGSFVPKYDNNGKLLPGEGIDVESLFAALRNIVPGEKFATYELMGDFAEMFFSGLVDSGVSPDLAKQARRWWGEIAEEAIYEAERVGGTHLTMGSGEMMFVGEHQVHGLGPQLTAQAWDGSVHAPDPKVIRRIANESDLLGRISNRITSKKFKTDTLPGKYGNETLEDRMWFRFADGVMKEVWKPFVLLRAAWTIRIAIDDQMRIGAEGYGALNHPFRLFQYGVTMPKDWWTLFKKGQVDIHGTLMKADEVSDMAHGLMYQKAMMKKWDERVGGAGTYGYRHTKTVARSGENHSQYIEGLSTDIAQLRASPITKTLANSKANDPVHEAVIWLQGKGSSPQRRKTGIRERQELANIHLRAAQEGDQAGDTANVYSRILQGSDYDLLYEVVEKQWATLNQKLGGVVYLDDGNGVMRNYGNLHVKEGLPIVGGAKTKRAKWVIEERGDAELMSVVAGHNQMYGDILNSEDAMKSLRGALSTKVRAASDEKFPIHTRVADETRANYPETVRGTYNNAIRKLFDFFMTTPSNTLSRSPLFHRAYWDKMTELYPYMDDAMQTQLRSVANKANVHLAKKAARKTKGDVAGQLTDIDQADMLAKSFALTQVESTLFALSADAGRKNISQSMSLIFPFVEAWGEFMTRWGRLMVTGDRNIMNARRFQQGIEGARDSGFFYENEFGQEVFNYPAFLTKGQIGVHNALNNLPVLGGMLGPDVSPETEEALTQGQMLKPADAGMRQPSSVTGSVESMNFASGIIPGFGPVFQMASKAILPDDPKWDEVRTVISPFGQEGSTLGSLVPAWVKRVSASLGGGDDPQLNYQFTSAVQDIIRTQIDAGEWAGLTTPQQVNAKVEEAEGEARGLLMVRAAATYWTPASPSYRFQKQDANGMIWSYSNLGN
ncbi:MAG: hypothetical protein ACXQS1_05875, partial [Methermicoccaceae archaeon]